MKHFYWNILRTEMLLKKILIHCMKYTCGHKYKIIGLKTACDQFCQPFWLTNDRLSSVGKACKPGEKGANTTMWLFCGSYSINSILWCSQHLATWLFTALKEVSGESLPFVGVLGLQVWTSSKYLMTTGGAPIARPAHAAAMWPAVGRGPHLGGC